MKTKRLRLDYLTIIKYGILFFTFFVFSSLSKQQSILSVAVFSEAIFSNYNFLATLLLHFSSLLILSNQGMLLSSAIADIIVLIVSFFYKKNHIRINVEIILYSLLSLVPFIFIGSSTSFIDYKERLLSTVFTAFLSFVLYEFSRIALDKGLKFKLNYEEYAITIIFVILFGVGISNFISPLLFKAIAIFILLLASFVYKMGITSIISSILGLTLSIYYTDISYMAIFLILALGTETFSSISRYLSACAIVLTDYIVFFLFKGYSSYALLDFFTALIPSLLFCLIPTKQLTKLKDKLFLFREKQLTRLSINRNRAMLSNKLYDISTVFTEIASTFSDSKESSLDEKKAKSMIKKEVVSSVCLTCPLKNDCKTNFSQKNTIFDKLIDIGVAKGKLTLIDFPKDLCEYCPQTNNILFALNKLLFDYRKHILEEMNLNISRDLLKQETLGISDVLKGLAIESGTQLKYQSKLERQIANELLKQGVIISELLIYGDNKETEVSMVITMKEFSLTHIEKIISKCVGFYMSLSSRHDIDEDKCYLSFRIACEYDAVFGLSIATKNGSIKSGDTHSIIRLKEDKFLVALSDGMGSGEQAEKISSTSLSLIETFYRAGLNEELILTTINKLLNISSEDTFTALDVAVINLKECSGSFIKYGSPYGFIINSDGIKIVEGNTLPLGILENIKPSVAKTQLNDGDIILLLTDGISDSFGSSNEVIDYLRTLPCLNPQTMSDSIISKAIEKTNGKAIDDMTVLAVRVFKKAE